MGPRIKKAIGIILCVAVFFAFFQPIQYILQPPFEGSINSYARVNLFYDEDPSPDVVFIGSSHVFYDINPLVLFKEYGIAGYDFSTTGQGAEVTKMFVEEAIKTHTPKVIAIDSLRIFRFLNGEVNSRQWFDPIPLSWNKIKTVWQMLQLNQELDLGIEYDSFLSYIFPLMRFHSRWEEIDELDFGKANKDLSKPYYHKAVHYHGYGPHFQTVPADFSDYYNEVRFDEAILAEAKKFFEEIVCLCEKTGTELLLIKTPSPTWRQGYHDLIVSWADEYGVPFIDFNDLIGEAGIVISEDFADYNQHLNDSGAAKLSSYLGQCLRETYDLPDHRDDPAYASWDNDWLVYQRDKASYFLANETDWTAYIEKLQDPNYTIYFTARDTLGGDRYPEITGQLMTLGLTPALETAARTGYIAIIDGGEVVFEQLEDAPLTYKADINGHHIEMTSKSYNHGNAASIQLDWEEMFVDSRGIGIVVYDNLLEDVVDSVTFDLWEGGVAHR